MNLVKSRALSAFPAPVLAIALLDNASKTQRRPAAGMPKSYALTRLRPFGISFPGMRVGRLYPATGVNRGVAGPANLFVAAAACRRLPGPAACFECRPDVLILTV